jgi:phage internal scaffolding protein
MIEVLPDSKLSKGRKQYVCKDESRTIQADAKLANINNIMDRYLKTGVLPQVQQKVAMYIDNTKLPDFLEAHNLIIEAKNLFMELPAHVRKLMDNDPAKLESFIKDPNNREILEKYGVIEKKVTTDKVEDSGAIKDQQPQAGAKGDKEEGA